MFALAAVAVAKDVKKPEAKNSKRSLEHIGLGTNLITGYSGLGLGGLTYGSGLGYAGSYGSKYTHIVIKYTIFNIVNKKKKLICHLPLRYLNF